MAGQGRGVPGLRGPVSRNLFLGDFGEAERTLPFILTHREWCLWLANHGCLSENHRGCLVHDHCVASWTTPTPQTWRSPRPRSNVQADAH